MHRSELTGDFRSVGIDPEIRAWAGFSMEEKRQSLKDLIGYTGCNGHLTVLQAHVRLDTGEIIATNQIDPTRDYWHNTQKAPGRRPEASQQ